MPAPKITTFPTHEEIVRQVISLLISKGYLLCNDRGNRQYKLDSAFVSFLKPLPDTRSRIERFFRIPHRHAFVGTLVGLNLKNWTLIIHGPSYKDEMTTLAEELRQTFNLPVRILLGGPIDLFETFNSDK
jgi:hypothetical protein